jgi:hypothetical protein
VRIKGKQEHNRVALTVIYFLGSIAFLATASSAFLIHEAVISENTLDAAAVALVGQMVSIVTLGLGALGAMLSSTSPKTPPSPLEGSPEPVPVVGVPGGEPVAVEPVEPVTVEQVPSDPEQRQIW